MSLNMDAARLHAVAVQRFCDLGETVLKLAADANWGEIVETTADALNGVDAVEEGDEVIYERAKAAAKRADEAIALLREFVDAEPCVYDHNGLCQTHFLGERPCENERARELLAASGESQGSETREND